MTDPKNYIIKDGVLRRYHGSQTTLIIPAGITGIGRRAFDHSNVQELILSDEVTDIEEEAFRYCYALETVFISKSVTRFGALAFADCYRLKSFSVDEGNPYYDSRGDSHAVIDTQSNTLLFGGASTVIPDSVSSIGNNAFRGNESLQRMVIPASVKTIGRSAFAGCSRLEEVILCEGLQRIGDLAFNGCAMEKIIIPDSVIRLDNTTFFACHHLSATINTENIRELGNGVFGRCKSIKLIDRKRSLSTVTRGNRAFFVRGFMEDYLNYPEDTRLEYVDYLREHREYFLKELTVSAATARCFAALALIEKSEIDDLLEAAQKNGKSEIVAILLEYAKETFGAATAAYLESLHLEDEDDQTEDEE